MLSVNNDLINYIFSNGRVKQNLTLPYQDVNILLIELFPYNTNKYVLYVDSFIGIFVCSFLDFNPIGTSSIFEISNVVSSLVDNLYYNKISNIIEKIIVENITKNNNIIVNSPELTKNMVFFIPFEVYYDSDETSFEVLYKEVHDGLFVKFNQKDQGSYYIDSSNNLINKFSGNVIDTNVDEIYGAIFYDKIVYRGSPYYYESVVYKKINSNNIIVYFKNSYLNIETIKNVGEIFTSSDFSNNNVFISFIPSNVIIYVNRGTRGIRYYRLIDYSVNQIKIYLRNLYGLNYVNIVDPNKFYPSNINLGQNRFKYFRNISGNEIIPNYIYFKDDIVINIADKIFNFTYFDLTESSVVRSNIPYLYTKYQEEYYSYFIYNENDYYFRIFNDILISYNPDYTYEYTIMNDSSIDLTNSDIVIRCDLNREDATNILILFDETSIISTFYVDDGWIFIRIPFISAMTMKNVKIFKFGNNKYFMNNFNNVDYLPKVDGLLLYYDLSYKNNNPIINLLDFLPPDRIQVSGQNNNGALFNGSNNFIFIRDTKVYNVGDKFTVFVDFTTSSTTTQQYVFGSPNSSSGFFNYGIILNGQSNNGSIGAYFGRAGNQDRFVRSGANRILANRRYISCFSYLGGNTVSSIRLFLDGTEISDTTGSNGSFSQPSSVSGGYIGVYGGNLNFLNGMVGKFIFFNRDLSTSEIGIIFNNYENLFPLNNKLYILRNFDKIKVFNKILDYTQYQTDFSNYSLLSLYSYYKLKDFQVPVIIDTKRLIDSNKLSVDGTDLVFIDDEGNVLPYYIFSGQNSNSTIIFLKLYNISYYNNIYIFYNNKSKSFLRFRNPDLVFEIFDDFNFLDTYKQTFTGPVSISNSRIQINNSGNSGSSEIYSNKIFDYYTESINIVSGNSTDMRFTINMGTRYNYNYDDLASSGNKGLYDILLNSFIDNQHYDHGSNTFNGIFRVKITNRYFLLEDPVVKYKTFLYNQNPYRKISYGCQYFSQVLIDRILIKKSVDFEPIQYFLKEIK